MYKRQCNVLWNDLVAQRFFDVDAVLFGGGLGDSNTALTMVSFIVLLFIAIMFVLIRRMKDSGSEDFDWEEEFADDDEETSNVESTESEETYIEPATESQTTAQTITESNEDLRTRLAAEAKRTGIMQAAPGTEQGKTGWYIDSDGQLTSWLVSETGEWTRVS